MTTAKKTSPDTDKSEHRRKSKYHTITVTNVKKLLGKLTQLPGGMHIRERACNTVIAAVKHVLLRQIEELVRMQRLHKTKKITPADVQNAMRITLNGKLGTTAIEETDRTIKTYNAKKKAEEESPKEMSDD